MLLGAGIAHAATGSVDSTNKYAWGNIAGWVNFASTNGNVTVTDTAVTGYAWSTDDGWINLSPTSGGVTNDGKGNLGGFAWDELNGWVSFQGVTIDVNGIFHGEATGVTTTGSQNILNFDCAHCKVQTSWHASVTTNPTSTTNSSSGVSGQSTGRSPQNTNTNPATLPPQTPVPSLFPATPVEPPANEAVPGVYPDTNKTGSGTSGGSRGASASTAPNAPQSILPGWLFPNVTASSTDNAGATGTSSSHALFPHLSKVAIVVVAGGGAILALLLIGLFFLL